MRNQSTLLILIIIAILSLLSLQQTSAKTYTVTNSGKWNDVRTWNNDFPGNEIKAADSVIISSNIIINAEVAISGTMIIKKGAFVSGNKDLMITKQGTLVNNGSLVTKRILNDGTVYNNMVMEAMQEIENKGTMYNDRQIVAGTNFMNYGGTAEGASGNYFANNNIIASNGGKFGKNVKVYYGSELESNLTETSMNTRSELRILADLTPDNGIQLTVMNTNKEKVAFFAIEKSTDGNSFKSLDIINGSTFANQSMMTYTDKNIKTNVAHYRIKAINEFGDGNYLPTVTVNIPDLADASASNYTK